MKKRYLIGGALVALMAIGAVGAGIEEKQLAELRETDFDSYLAQIRQQDEALYFHELKRYDRDRWIDELKSHDLNAWLEIAKAERPDEYADHQAAIAETIAQLDAKVKSIPAEDIDTNLSMYDELIELAPENEHYQEKRAHYASLVADRDWTRQNCSVAKTRESAILYANEVVRASLKSPRSARFPWPDKPNVASLGECSFLVSSYVDAENSFGAEIRSRFEVTLEISPTGWSVDDVVIY